MVQPSDVKKVEDDLDSMSDDLLDRWYEVHNETAIGVFSESDYRPAYAVAALIVISRLE